MSNRNYKVTMSEVAARAGVSRATVSRLLNNKTSTIKITDATKQRVYEAIEELGYYPNRLAQGLRNQRKEIIGLSIPSYLPPNPLHDSWVEMHTAHIGKLVCGVQMVTHPSNHDIHIFERYEYRGDGASYRSDPRLDFVDGLVYATPNPKYPRYEDAIRAGLPLIFIGPNPTRSKITSVCIDNTAVHYQITKALVEAGHERIGMLLAEEFDAPLSKLRLRGFHLALEEKGISAANLPVFFGSFKPKDMKQIARDVFDYKPLPTAIVIGRNDLALYVFREMQRREIRCPEDVELIVYGDDHAFEHMNPTLTAFDIGFQQLAAETTRQLFDELEGKAEPGRVLFLPGKLRVRESCVLNVDAFHSGKNRVTEKTGHETGREVFIRERAL
jgi:LacI family transcriptional regulator